MATNPSELYKTSFAMRQENCSCAHNRSLPELFIQHVSLIYLLAQETCFSYNEHLLGNIILKGFIYRFKSHGKVFKRTNNMIPDNRVSNA